MLIFMAGAAFVGIAFYPLQYYLFALAVSASAALHRAAAAPVPMPAESHFASALSGASVPRSRSYRDSPARPVRGLKRWCRPGQGRTGRSRGNGSDRRQRRGRNGGSGRRRARWCHDARTGVRRPGRGPLREGRDLHAETAAMIARVPLAEAARDKTLRQKAKAINFGSIFGMGGRALSDYAFTSYDAMMSESEARGYLDELGAPAP